MNKKYTILLALFFATLIMQTFFELVSFENRGFTFEKLIMMFVEFCCYAIPFLAFSFKKKTISSLLVGVTLVVGSVLFYFCSTIDGIYSDWKYISVYPNDLFARHIVMLFWSRVSMRVMFIMFFLFAYFALFKVISRYFNSSGICTC